MDFVKRIWNGPYSLGVYLTVVSLGASLITGTLVYLEGTLLYQGHAFIPSAVHISETFFTGVLATVITGLILHRHASKNGTCETLRHHGRCPFLGILLLGLVLGGVALAMVVIFQKGETIPYEDLVCTKVIQGVLTGLVIAPLFHLTGLLRHGAIRYE